MLGAYAGAQPYYNDAVGAAVQVKSGRGQIIALKIINPNASAAYLQLFGLLLAGVALGTTAPDAVIPLGASEVCIVPLPVPLQLGQLNGNNGGITIAGTTTFNGPTAVATGLKVFALYE